MKTCRKDAKNAKDCFEYALPFFASFVLYRDVRMPRAQDAQERPSLRRTFFVCNARVFQ